MRFVIKKTGENLLGMARKAGYIPQKSTDAGEMAFIRPIQRDFPRFHLYIKEGVEEFNFNLHLDQKKPSYGRETAHSGEYEGELVTEESARIKQLLSKPAVQNVAPPSQIPEKTEAKTSRLGNLFKKILG